MLKILIVGDLLLADFAFIVNMTAYPEGSEPVLNEREIGNSHSRYPLYRKEIQYTQDPELADLFYSFTGHTYRTGVEDYFEVIDIMCYIFNEFSFDY